MTEAYFVIGLFISGAFVAEAVLDRDDPPKSGLLLFMFVIGTVFWPMALGMRFGRKWLS